jgi:hypothetical protein
MHVFLFVDDPTLGVVATPVAIYTQPEDQPMSRKLALLFFAAAVTVITACSNFTGPNRDEDEEEGDSSAYCGVVAGTHTRCVQ